MTQFVLLLRLIVAGVLLQTLYFKFSGAPESIFIFSTLGVEPLGRWFAGFTELIASGLILWPTTQALGASVAAGTMFGAIASHLLFLGIEVQGDGGLLFILALIVMTCSSVIAFLRRDQLIQLFVRVQKNW